MKRKRFRFRGILAHMSRRNKKLLKNELSELYVRLYNVLIGVSPRDRKEIIKTFLMDVLSIAAHEVFDRESRKGEKEEFIRKFREDRDAFMALGGGKMMIEVGDRVRRVVVNGSVGVPIGGEGIVEKVVLSVRCLHVKTDGEEHAYIYHAVDWEKLQ